MSKEADKQAYEDAMRVQKLQDEIKKMVKPIRCPICQCEVQVIPLQKPDENGHIYKTKIVRESSVESCPRCGCGKKQVEAALRKEAEDAEKGV